MEERARANHVRGRRGERPYANPAVANALKLSNARLSKLARVMCTCSPAAGWCAPARHPPHLWVWLPPPPLNTQFQVCARPVNAVNPRVVDVVIPTTAQRSSKTRWVGVVCGVHDAQQRVFISLNKFATTRKTGGRRNEERRSTASNSAR